MNALAGIRSRIWLAALAFAGLVAGHWLAYLVVAPDAHAREELLRATGHGSHNAFVTLGLAAAVAAVIAVIATHLKSGGSGDRGSGIARSAVTLWVLQTTGFVALEVAERAHGLHEIATLLHEPAFQLGLVAQALVAVAAALVVFLLRTTLDVIRRLLAPSRAARAVRSLVLRERRGVRSSVARAAWNLRGPPIAAVPG